MWPSDCQNVLRICALFYVAAWLLGVAAVETISVVLYALSLPVAVMLIYRALRDLNMDVLKKLYVVILSGAGGNFTGKTQPNKSDQTNISRKPDPRPIHSMCCFFIARKSSVIRCWSRA